MSDTPSNVFDLSQLQDLKKEEASYWRAYEQTKDKTYLDMISNVQMQMDVIKKGGQVVDPANEPTVPNPIPSGGKSGPTLTLVGGTAVDTGSSDTTPKAPNPVFGSAQSPDTSSPSSMSLESYYTKMRDLANQMNETTDPAERKKIEDEIQKLNETSGGNPDDTGPKGPATSPASGGGPGKTAASTIVTIDDKPKINITGNPIGDGPKINITNDPIPDGPKINITGNPIGDGPKINITNDPIPDGPKINITNDPISSNDGRNLASATPGQALADQLAESRKEAAANADAASNSLMTSDAGSSSNPSEASFSPVPVSSNAANDQSDASSGGPMNTPSPYARGAPAVDVSENQNTGVTQTTTSTGAVIDQNADGTPYRAGWVDPNNPSNPVLSGASNPYTATPDPWQANVSGISSSINGSSATDASTAGNSMMISDASGGGYSDNNTDTTPKTLGFTGSDVVPANPSTGFAYGDADPYASPASDTSNVAAAALAEDPNTAPPPPPVAAPSNSGDDGGGIALPDDTANTTPVIGTGGMWVDPNTGQNYGDAQ